MLDCHCHLDRYPRPIAIAEEAARRGVFVVAVTHLPSHFEMGLGHACRLPSVRLALGLHPLAVESHARELARFQSLLRHTSFVGEVGLDFSREGKASADNQLESFEFVVRSVAEAGAKVMSLHSRGAEAKVLRVLRDYGLTGAIFHWFSGSPTDIDRIAEAGHYFSINPQMTFSAKGRAIIERIPVDRVLTETDGPYSKVRGAPAQPWDVAIVENHLATTWERSREDVAAQIWTNFRRMIEPVRQQGGVAGDFSGPSSLSPQ